LGIHYVGEMHKNSFMRVIMDQLTDGQLDWVPMANPYDVISIGGREYTLSSGRETFAKELERQFPEEKEAIKEFMRLSKIIRGHVPLLGILKVIPLWLALLLIRLGVIHWISPIFKLACSKHSEIINKLTTNKDLRVIFSYFYYGLPPKDSSFFMLMILIHHYRNGAWYPRGGPGEIAFQIIPIIERAGGAVLMKARVGQILVSESGEAIGVTVEKKGSKVNVYAPVVISDAGIFNTFGKLLPPEIRSKRGAFLEPLYGSVTQTLPCLAQRFTKYAALPREEVSKNVPMAFISFPSAKDPTYEERHPGCSCMTIVTMARYEWFEEWSEGRLRNRGADYEALKMEIAQKLVDMALEKFPQLSDKVIA
ncbi:hypothetical protein lerEdw1_014150, partial [Lerista edwardsae]